MIEFIGWCLAMLTRLLSAPFVIVGYVACHLTALCYFGWAKAEKHQAKCVAIYERNHPGDEK